MKKATYYFATKEDENRYLIHEVTRAKFGDIIRISYVNMVSMSNDVKNSKTLKWITDYCDDGCGEWDKIIDGKVAESYLLHLKVTCEIIGDSINDLERKHHQNFLNASKSILYQNKYGESYQISEGYLLWFLNTVRQEGLSEDIIIAKLMLEEVGVNVEDF